MEQKNGVNYDIGVPLNNIIPKKCAYDKATGPAGPPCFNLGPITGSQ